MYLQRIIILALSIFCFVAPFHCAAFGVVIEEKEFVQLQRHCQMFYASTSIGRRLGYSTKFLDGELKEANKAAEIAGGAWHYCAGLVHLKRAQQTGDKKIQLENYKRAVDEIGFTARNIPTDNQYFGEVQLNMARALFFIKSPDKSTAMLKALITTKPNYLPGYIELAQQSDRQGKTQDAIVILNSAPSKFKLNSADLNYFLGIYYFKLKDFDNAKQHAKVAYANGYPLPGLKNMLKKQGHHI